MKYVLIHKNRAHRLTVTSIVFYLHIILYGQKRSKYPQFSIKLKTCFGFLFVWLYSNFLMCAIVWSPLCVCVRVWNCALFLLEIILQLIKFSLKWINIFPFWLEINYRTFIEWTKFSMVFNRLNVNLFKSINYVLLIYILCKCCPLHMLCECVCGKIMSSCK